MNPLPVEKFLDGLGGSIFWRYLVLLKVLWLGRRVLLWFNISYVLLRLLLDWQWTRIRSYLLRWGILKEAVFLVNFYDPYHVSF